MIHKYFRTCGTYFLRSLFKYTPYALKILHVSILGLLITACVGVNDTNSNLSDPSIPEATISGSVGDGPITAAQIKITDSTGAVLGSTASDTAASYTINLPQGTNYPVVIMATGGTDMVTGAEPDFTLLSVAMDSSANTVNINPFSTLIVKTAQAMSGGLTLSNLSAAKQVVLDQLNFGLDSVLVVDPIATPINEANVAVIIKASEAFGEVIRRTQSTLLISGLNYTGDNIIDAIAGDMTDGVLDGRGSGADVRIAATANVVAGQVLVEALVNRLNVNGADATTLMDIAINLSVPSATMTTSDVTITDGMLKQTRTAVAAAQAHTPSAILTAIAVALVNVNTNSMAADIDAILPADPGFAFSEVVTQLPLSTDAQLNTINAVIKSGFFEIAGSTYNVGESDGSVNITINRVGGSAGEVTVDWRTQGVTATFAQDYGNFSWTPLTFVDGETSKSGSIAIVSDAEDEADETFNVLLGNVAGGAVLGSNITTLVTIVDDDASPAPEPEPVPEPEPIIPPVFGDRPWEALLNQAVGFGGNATGGLGGEVCLVQNLNDSGPDSLRDCTARQGSQWIRFNVSGAINLKSPLNVKSNTTIDGSDADITILAYGLKLWGVNNVIIHNLKIENIANTGENIENRDAISLRQASSDIWIDHVSVSNAQDELIEIGQASTDITVSWTKVFSSTAPTARNYGMILGFAYQQPEDVVMRVTLHHNYFSGLIERSPRMRYGKFHAFNNYYYNWKNYASWASQDSQYNSENNIYEAVSDLDAILSGRAGSDPLPGEASDQGSWLLGGAKIQERNPQNVFDATTNYNYTLETAEDALRTRVKNGAGWNNSPTF